MRCFQSLAFLIGLLFSTTVRGQGIVRQRVDTSTYSILKYDTAVGMVMYNRFYRPKPTSLTATEVDDMEKLVDSSYCAYNEKHPYQQLIGPISEYRRQYVAIINGTGQKEVWINFFCSDFNLDWRHQVLMVHDGGVCYFQLQINLTLRKAYKIYHNGEA